MAPIDDASTLARPSDEPLVWRRVAAFSREHELRGPGDRLLGRLTVRGWRRREAEAECGGRRWRFVRRSWVSFDVLVLDAESGREIGRYVGGWLGRRSLRLEDGEEFRWRRLSLWRRERGFTREDGEPLVVFRSRFRPFRTSADVFVDTDARRLAALPLLLTLGWYLVLRRRAHARHG